MRDLPGFAMPFNPGYELESSEAPEI